MSVLVVAPCSVKAARYAISRWHYSGALPAGKVVGFGVWEDSAFIGAVVFGWGANRHLSTSFGLDITECAELVRVGLRSHDAPVSQVVARSLVDFRRSNPGMRLVVSFADPHQGHHGGIYQAGNWVYTGVTKPKFDYVMPDGTVLNRRSYTGNHLGGRRRTVPKTATKLQSPGKHRYVYPLDRAMRRQVSKLALPYPSRGSGLEGETAAVQAEGPGSIPGNRSTAPVTS